MSEKTPELFLFVWDKFDSGCTDGLAFAIAETPEKAQYLIKKKRVGSKCAVARITNLEADGGEGLTDSQLTDALSIFPPADHPSLGDDWGPVHRFPVTQSIAFCASGGA